MIVIPKGVEASFGEIMRTEVPRPFAKEAFRFSVPLWWAGQVFQLRGAMDRAVTRLMLGPKPLGSIQAMATMWQFVAKPMEFFGQATLPGLASAKEEELDVLYREIVRISFLTFCFVSIGVAGGMPLVFQVIDFVFGHLGRDSPPLAIKYAEVPILMMLSVLAIPATAVEMVTNQYAVVLGKQGLVFRAQVVTVIVLGLLIWPLTNEWDLYGVIAAGNVAEFANAGVFIFGLWTVRNASMRSTLYWLVSSMVLTFAATGVIYWFHGTSRFDWLWTFPALGVFVVGSLLLGVLRLGDFKRLLNAIRRRKLTPEIEVEDEP